MSTILTKMIKDVRDLVQDQEVSDYYPAEFISSSVFTLPFPVSDINSIRVFNNGNPIINSTGWVYWTFDIITNRITCTETLSLGVGDFLEVYYNCYKKYTDTEIKSYINSAIIRLSVEKYQDFILGTDDIIFPTPVLADGRLICFISSILMAGNLARYRTAELEIEFAKDEDNETLIKRAIRQFKKTYGVIDYVNLRRPYTLYVEDSDQILTNLP